MRLSSLFRLDLRGLILTFAMATALLTLANTFIASYLAQRDQLIGQTLEANRVYAVKLANSTESFLQLARQQLGYSASQLAEQFDQPQRLSAEVERLRGQSNLFNSTYVIDSQRQLLAISPPVLLPTGTQIDSAGAREAVALRQPLVSQPFVSAAGRLVIAITHPVFAADGRYLGYVGGSIYLREQSILHNLLSDHFYTDDTSLQVVDRQGAALYHTDPQRVGEPMLENPAVAAVIRGESSSQQLTSPHGIDMLAGYAPVASTGWGIVAQRPTASILAELDTLLVKILRNAVPVSLLTLLALWWLSRLIARPLRQLAGSARLTDSLIAAREIQQVSSWYFEAAELRRAMLVGLAQVNQRIGRLHHESTTDPLTGLLNRRGLQAQLQLWQASGRPLAIIAIDIDHFKSINDRLGHAAGDQLLRHLAQLMRQVARHDDLLCRNGGEEFLLLLPDTSLASACAVAERLRQCVADSPGPDGVTITISLGVAYCADSNQLEQALERADQALYAAKQQGRNKVVTAGAA